MVAAVGPDVAVTEDIVLVTEVVLGAGAEAAVVVVRAVAAVDEAGFRLLVTVVFAGVVTEAAVEAGALGLPGSSAIA